VRAKLAVTSEKSYRARCAPARGCANAIFHSVDGRCRLPANRESINNFSMICRVLTHNSNIPGPLGSESQVR